MADVVERVLQEAAEKESQYKTVDVHKDIDVEIDEGNLLAVDQNPLDIKFYRWLYGSPTIYSIIAHMCWANATWMAMPMAIDLVTM